MFELMIVYKMPNGKNVVSIINYITIENLTKNLPLHISDIGQLNVICMNIRPIAIG